MALRTPTFTQQLKRVYLKPSPIPVRVKTIRGTRFRHYPTRSGQQIFDYDIMREFDNGRLGFKDMILNRLSNDKDNVLELNFFYVNDEVQADESVSKCAILIYFDAQDVTWKVITMGPENSLDTVKYYKLVNTQALEEVDREGNRVLGRGGVVLYSMYFDMETGTWEDLPPLDESELPAQYDTAVSTFRVRI